MISLYDCQQLAKTEGFDFSTFTAIFPSGPKKCTWLDAYFGLFQVDGLEGFLRVDDIVEKMPHLLVSPPVRKES
jgi:hypothetical protein